MAYFRESQGIIPYKYNRKKIPDGLAGTHATVREMVRLVKQGTENPEVRQLATGIISGVEEKNPAAEAAALHSWVKNRIRYTRDPVDLELLTPAEKLPGVGHGDCDDMAILLASLLRAVGIQARFSLVSNRRRGPFQHIFVEAKTGRGWMALDPTQKDQPAGWRPGPQMRRASVPI